MKKLFKWQTWLMMGIFACFVVLAAGSEGDVIAPGDGTEPTVPTDPIQTLNGIVSLTSGIGDWDGAYLTKYGYFCYGKDALAKGKDDETEGKYSAITYMSLDGDDIVSLLSTKDEKIPTQMVLKDAIVYFSFPNDSILELIYDDGKTVTMLDSIPYSKAALVGAGDISTEDAFRSSLANAADLLKKKNSRAATTSSLANAYGTVFEAVSGLNYEENEEAKATLSHNDVTGNYTFVDKITSWFDEKYSKYVYYTLSLWTGKATYKVGGSSCTLSGTIWCPSNTFNEYGTYGIICDSDESKLTLGSAEYEGTGYQTEDELSYSVDFRGFKPNTTYYYRAYYKFNSSDHGRIIPKYGNLTDQVIYDTTVKSFETGDNILTVDVVMCIDVTGSMGGIINTVKRNAIGFYDSFNKCCEEEGIQLASLNAQVIAFRDKNVDGNWLQTSSTYSLPAQQSDFNGFVNGLYADGGGDTPESGMEALEAAFNKTDWGVDDGYHRQVVILWTDASYLIGAYSSLTVDEVEAMWNSMPSGRRLILFAPYGTYDSNGASWGNLDGWKNLIHETDLSNGFNNFEYILKSIIGELTSKAPAKAPKKVSTEPYFFRPNK